MSKSRIRDEKKFGSGINIPDPRHCAKHSEIIFFAIKRSVSSSVADPGCLSRIRIFFIPDPNFFIPDPNFFAIKRWRKSLSQEGGVSSSDHSSAAAVMAAATAQQAPVISRTPIVWDVSPAATQHHHQPAASTSPQRPVVRSLVSLFSCFLFVYIQWPR